MPNSNVDIDIRIDGRAGRITLNRPQALNALTYKMCLEIEAALDLWRDDPVVKLVIIDANGDKAFSAGGDIQEMYDTGKAGDYAYGQKFWFDEYRINAKIAGYPKPYVAFMQGFTMGGGVGVSCHGSHRIVGETSQIAMPECGIGLVPDVGGSFLLASAPGHAGEYLGLTSARMAASDAIYAGFADFFIAQDRWRTLIEILCVSGDVFLVQNYASSEMRPDPGPLQTEKQAIDILFSGGNAATISERLKACDTEFAAGALKNLGRNSPLSLACATEMLHQLRPNNDIAIALNLEYRFTFRAMQHGDFIEGIRAAIIDRDRKPHWKHDSLTEVLDDEVAQMLAPLGNNGLNLMEQLA
ncbi:MAG: enoyl-CoA hydratase [Candidatus Paceibacteria bacterium]|jgi:enoyl-CoA hydratase